MAKKLPEVKTQLSILICTIPERYYVFNDIREKLVRQIDSNDLSKEVEILSDDRVDITIGQKRNELIEKSNGKFIVFVDDDDDVHENYVSLIVQTINEFFDINNNSVNVSAISTPVFFTGSAIDLGTLP